MTELRIGDFEASDWAEQFDPGISTRFSIWFRTLSGRIAFQEKHPESSEQIVKPCRYGGRFSEVPTSVGLVYIHFRTSGRRDISFRLTTNSEVSTNRSMISPNLASVRSFGSPSGRSRKSCLYERRNCLTTKSCSTSGGERRVVEYVHSGKAHGLQPRRTPSSYPRIFHTEETSSDSKLVLL